MFTLLIRKMRNTKWMVICLALGFIMASAMMSTIPLYMNASLQRMLVKDMEAYQIQNDENPGLYSVNYNLPLDINSDKQTEIVEEMAESFKDNFDDLGFSASSEKKTITDTYLYAKNIDKTFSGKPARFYLTGMTDIYEHIQIKNGRLPDKSRNDGIFECVMTEDALQNTGFDLDQTYLIASAFNENVTTKVKIVGMFDVKDQNDSFWSEGLDETYVSTMFVDYDTMLSEMIKTNAVSIVKMSEHHSIDYHSIDMTSLSGVIDKLAEQDKVYLSSGVTLSVPALDILRDYADRSSQLKLILWLIQIPVMLMILFYLFMVSKMNVEAEKNEIAVFKSRGASRLQIMFIYALESIILGIITAIVGPFLGLLLCNILGASNGFLEFVNRTALPIKLSAEAFLYASLAVCVFFLTTLIPTYPATNTTIVEHKTSKALKRKIPLWKKLGFDIILIAGSIVWLYFYNSTQQKLISQGVNDTTATVNPMLFVASTAFILGCGLFVIRIYPLIIRLVYKIGKRFWTPAQYVSLNNIGRSSTGRESFIMVFLILTISLGLFFANTARALNRNAEEKIHYSIGCDAVIAEEWYNSSNDSSVTQEQASSISSSNVSDESSEDSDTDASALTYIEPSFERFENLDGVKSATRVYKNDSVNINSPRKVTLETPNSDKDKKGGWEGYNDNSYTTDTIPDVSLMTVNPSEFSKICWFKDELLPVHINSYLNALSECNYGVILSSSFKNSYGYEKGDKVKVSWGSNSEFDATVLAFADYWPSINPHDKNDDGRTKDFAIMNFDYVQIKTAIEPYEVWIDLDDSASVSDFYNSIEESYMEPTKLNVASQEVISEKNDPMLQGMNGALTLGFIIIMIMCFIGFLIYWILSIKARTLQFGILRAMGMTFKEIIGLLFYEQFLVSGMAIVASVIIGGIASNLFVPLFQSLFNSYDAVPPFSVVPLRSDYMKVYVIIGVMLVICFTVLGRIISKIKISQALKLGED